jgi:serine phosphatase RsbU (regulator of sigma subunit)
MNAPRMEEEQAPSSQPSAVLEPAVASALPWHRAQEFLREIEGHLRLVPAHARERGTPLRRRVERRPATREALRQAHEEQVQGVAVRTAELAQANAVLEQQLTESAQAQRRLAAEHAVARILAESISLTDAAPRLLQAISHSLEWDVGALWTIDRDAEVLECLEVWHEPLVAIPAFEQVSRQSPFAPGIGLPGRVWASGGPVWIPDVTGDANFPGAPIAAREGLHAAVGFPVRNGTEFLGVLGFFSRKIRQPDEELLRMMTSIGSHISQFIERMKAEQALVRKDAELGIARRIQQGLVAKVPPALTGFDIAGSSHCADETGGDYFDFFPLLGSCQGIVIADASGHGLGPALVITETRAYLRAFALTYEDIGRIVTLVNRRLAEDVGDDYFVTLFLARLDPQTRSVRYTSAGHMPGFLFDRSGGVKTVLGSTDLPLGIVHDADFSTATEITLEPGELLLLLTDGVVEARAPDGTAFGLGRALDIVRVYRRDTAAQIAYNLYHAVRAFAHNHPQVDDITAVVLKSREVSGAGPHNALAFPPPGGYDINIAET